MHYYKRNLGDYAKKAGRLSMLQHGSYTLLIDACYDREQFPTIEEAIEWTWASSAAEIEAVEFVLRKFFTPDGDVYVQKRIQEELADYHMKANTNKRIATERETKRKEKSTNRAPDVHEPPPNQEPLTINHEPLTINQEDSKESKTKSKTIVPAALLAALGVGDVIAADWITLRKAKKAAITETAIQGIQREAEKAGMSLEAALRTCCERGWSGFKAEWATGGKVVRDLEAEMRAFCGEEKIIEGEIIHVGR